MLIFNDLSVAPSFRKCTAVSSIQQKFCLLCYIRFILNSKGSSLKSLITWTCFSSTYCTLSAIFSLFWCKCLLSYLQSLFSTAKVMPFLFLLKAVWVSLSSDTFQASDLYISPSDKVLPSWSWRKSRDLFSTWGFEGSKYIYI